MLNRPATKIELCLEEEINEYEDMKLLRQQSPNLFNQHDNNNKNLLGIKDIGLEEIPTQEQLNDDIIIDKNSFFCNSRHNYTKEFNLNNVLFSNESITKHDPFKLENNAQFKTPENK